MCFRSRVEPVSWGALGVRGLRLWISTFRALRKPSSPISFLALTLAITGVAVGAL